MVGLATTGKVNIFCLKADLALAAGTVFDEFTLSTK